MRAAGITTLAAFVISAAQARQQPPTFTSNTNVVQVDVRVFKGSLFVTGLGPDDFVLTEDGVAQKIQSVVLVGAASPAPAVSGRYGAASPAPGTEHPAPSVWLFVFDTPHLSPAGLTHTRDAVLQFLETKWHEGDIGGVVYGGKMANDRLTSDTAELRRVVSGIKGTSEQRSEELEITREWPRFQDLDELIRVAVDHDKETLDGTVDRACNEEPTACTSGKGVDVRDGVQMQIMEKANRIFAVIQRASLNSLATLQGLSEGFARMPGAKTIVFISEGFVTSQVESTLKHVVGDAARAGAHVYAIDARGLNRGSASSSIIDEPFAASVIGTTRTRTPFDLQSDGPNSLAVDTGGFAIRNENNFGRALDEVQRDASEYYVIGYSPTNAAFDGKYRAIDVQVKQAGLKVRARRGYLALAPALLLKPAPIVGANDAKGANGANGADANGAENAVPDLPMVPTDIGVGALSWMVTSPVSRVAVANGVRARVESGVLTLKKFDAKDVAAGYAERGWAAYEQGDLETAANELSTAAAADKRPWVSYALGYADFGLRRMSDAIAAWTRVKKSAPEFEPVYFNLADALSLTGDETGAVRILREAEARWPKDAEIADAIGVIQVRRTALDEAIKSFHLATELAPADPVGFFNLGRAYQMRFNQSQRYDAAMEKWIGNDEDRTRAIAAYTKYIAMRGPYDQQAKEAISQLQWNK